MNSIDKNAYHLLLERLAEIAHLNACLALLQWDQEVLMPPKAIEARANTISYISVLTHEKLVSLNEGRVLSRLYTSVKSDMSSCEATVINETQRLFQREQKLPADFVKELSALCSVAQNTWAEARKKSDFSLFLPRLKRMVELKQKEAEFVGYKHSPYDALLDVYEPGLTSVRVTAIFEEVRDFLKPFVKSLQAKKNAPQSTDRYKGKFPLDEQQTFNREIAQKIGFDLDAGRLDVSTHPFTTSFHPQDVRLTTRYKEDDLLFALGSTIHEMGHGMYEQGLPSEHFGTALGEAVSLGIHESQSRIWENNLGKSLAFWQYFYPKLQKRFPKPFARVPIEKFYRSINQVQPSLIRTESDEVTYNLHIILRFEIERDLIEGRLKVKDVPEVWNAKMKEYLGISVPNDRVGVLQDVHWSSGAIGYFPTYALGNLYAAQFYHAAKQQIPQLDKQLARGNFKPVSSWLREKIHVHGKTYSSEALVKEVTGEHLQIRYFTDYLTKKYTQVYK